MKLLRAAAAGLTWDTTAAGVMLEAYDETLALADRDSRASTSSTSRTRGTGRCATRSAAPACRSSGRRSPLLPEPAQRALAALAKRPLTRGPLLGLLRLLSGAGGRGGTATAAELPPAVDPEDPDVPDGEDDDVETVAGDTEPVPVRLGAERRRAKLDP